MNKEIYDEWLKINVEIHNKLEKLKELDKERSVLIKEIESKGINDYYLEKMNNSAAKYNFLLEEIKVLKDRSERLKKEIN